MTANNPLKSADNSVMSIGSNKKRDSSLRIPAVRNRAKITLFMSIILPDSRKVDSADRSKGRVAIDSEPMFCLFFKVIQILLTQVSHIDFNLVLFDRFDLYIL